MREIRVAEHAGFCFGVSKAVETAYGLIEKDSERPLYCLGSLIHNKLVTEELSSKGLKTIESIEDAKDGSTLLIRAHGEPDSTYEAAKARNINIVDATCPFVFKIHTLAKEAEKEGRYLVVAGDENHPEVKGILGSSKLSLGAIYSEEEAQRISEENSDKKILLVAQTTIPISKFEECVKGFNKHPDFVTQNTICNATKERQEGAKKLASWADCMVVIGDKESSNSKKLKEICEEACKNVVFLEKTSDISLQTLEKYNKIGLAASASAPERIIKEVIAHMSELLTKDLQNEEMNEMAAYMDAIEESLKLPGRGEVVTGTVVVTTNDYVVVNLGRKKDGMLPKEEITLEEGQTLTDLFKEGDEVQAKVIKTDDGDGNILLSKKRLQSGENWDEITAALDSREVLNVTLIKEVKGGVIATYKEVSGFIPYSQLADHYVESAAEFIGKTLPVRVTRVDQKRNKAVFSHKSFLSEERNKKIAEIWDTLNVGDIVEGKVMRFTDYGAFVDIGGIDGLLHISEISWGKIKHPQEALEIGQTVNVKILSMNAEKGKISLGLKQNNPEPWSVIDDEYQVGQLINGKVVQIKEYGAFVELAPGLDGLVHISEVAHKRVEKIEDELTIGQEVEAKILEIDKERKRISLSIKACLPAPEVPEAPVEEAPAEEAPAEE